MAYLRRSAQRGIQAQIPNGLIINSRQIRRNGDGHRTIRLGDIALDLDPVVPVDGVAVAREIVVQPHGVGVTLVLGQGVLAVGGRRPVELDVNLGPRADGGVVGDALEDIDTGVVPLSPSW